MSGTREGGAKTAATIIKRHGKDYYKKIGAKGGRVRSPKGFALMTRESHRKASAKGGHISRIRRRTEDGEV
ncbi:hypothetical protein GCM10009648_43930 [Tsukamurella spumae]